MTDLSHSAAGRDPRSILDAIELAPPLGAADARPDGAHGSRVLLEAFAPVSAALEFRLSNAIWEQHGARPFVEGSVPYIVNNSGWGPAAAAQVLFASCGERRDSQQPVVALELGAGIGLFARQLLDTFQVLCLDRNEPFYDRLTYYVTDGSPRTLATWRESGLFDAHHDHVVMAQASALRPLELRAHDGSVHLLQDLHAVFCNYVLDSLPAAIVRGTGAQPELLHVRSWLDTSSEETSFAARTGLSVDEVEHIARTSDSAELTRLLPLLPWMQFETEYRRVDSADLRLAGRLLDFQGSADPTVLNYGAIDCLERCLETLDGSGFILVNDFGPVHASHVAGVAYPLRFGPAVSFPLHFAFLAQYLTETLGVHVHAPAGDEGRSIHSRLLTPRAAPETESAFLQTLEDPAFAAAESLPARANQEINCQRPQAALDCFRQGIRDWPEDWNLLTYAAQFVNQQLLRHEDALRLAQRAVEINPWFSALAWNTLGNCHFCLEQYDEAHRAYLHAAELHACDPQTQLNLAYSFEQMGRRAEALTAIARGLEYDADARFRTTLLDKQRQILERIDIDAARRIAADQRRKEAFTAEE